MARQPAVDGRGQLAGKLVGGQEPVALVLAEVGTVRLHARSRSTPPPLDR